MDIQYIFARRGPSHKIITISLLRNISTTNKNNFTLIKRCLVCWEIILEKLDIHYNSYQHPLTAMVPLHKKISITATVPMRHLQRLSIVRNGWKREEEPVEESIVSQNCLDGGRVVCKLRDYQFVHIIKRKVWNMVRKNSLITMNLRI